jgi:hypothetical protein
MDLTSERRYLLPVADNYVLSVDIDGRLSQSGAGWNLSYLNRVDKPSAFDVFPLRDDGVIGEHDAVWGHVEWLRGQCAFKSYGDAASASGDLLIRTRDGVMLEAAYYGTNRLQELGQRVLLTSKEDPQIEIKVFYWLQFETSHPKYRWLSQTPCVGFGRAGITGKAGRADDGFSFPLRLDVYALS